MSTQKEIYLGKSLDGGGIEACVEAAAALLAFSFP